jgi:hypothetical protein
MFPERGIMREALPQLFCLIPRLGFVPFHLQFTLSAFTVTSDPVKSERPLSTDGSAQ